MSPSWSPVFVAIAAAVSWTTSAHAETWIVSRLGTFGCFERAVMDELQRRDPGDREVPRTVLATRLAQRNCVMLQLGERLLYVPEPATGFGDFVRLRRGNGQEVYVRTSSIVRDPACGSVELDRPQ